jgi:hypothetical protein
LVMREWRRGARCRVPSPTFRLSTASRDTAAQHMRQHGVEGIAQ